MEDFNPVKPETCNESYKGAAIGNYDSDCKFIIITALES